MLSEIEEYNEEILRLEIFEEVRNLNEMNEAYRTLEQRREEREEYCLMNDIICDDSVLLMVDEEWDEFKDILENGTEEDLTNIINEHDISFNNAFIEQRREQRERSIKFNERLNFLNTLDIYKAGYMQNYDDDFEFIAGMNDREWERFKAEVIDENEKFLEYLEAETARYAQEAKTETETEEDTTPPELIQEMLANTLANIIE